MRRVGSLWAAAGSGFIGAMDGLAVPAKFATPTRTREKINPLASVGYYMELLIFGQPVLPGTVLLRAGRASGRVGPVALSFYSWLLTSTVTLLPRPGFARHRPLGCAVVG